MNRRRRGILLAILGVGLACVGVLVVYNILGRGGTPRAAPTTPPVRTEKVVVASRAIKLGSVLDSGDLSLQDVAVGAAPAGTIGDIESAVGRIAKVDFVAGELVMQHHLADPTNISHDLAFIIGDDMVLMAFPMEDLMSQINILQPGDQVDILVSLNVPVVEERAGLLAPAPQETQEPEEILFTFDALQRVVISAVIVEITETRTRSTSVTGETAEGTPQPTPTVAPSQIEARALLLALSPQDALVLKNLKDAGGTFDIVLRSPTSTRLFELSPVMRQYLIDRYQLEVTK